MATWLSGISRQHRIIRKNTFLWFGLFLLAFMVVLGKLAWMQTVDYHHFMRLADDLHKRTVMIPFKRGSLLDRNFVPLAVDSELDSLYADPSLIQYPDFIVKQLAPVINMPEAELLADLTRVTIKSRVPQTTADTVRQLNLPGVQVAPEGARLHIGVDWEKVDSPVRFTHRLAKSLNLPIKTLQKELEYIEPEPPKPVAPVPAAGKATGTAAAHPASEPPPPPDPVKPTGIHWLKATFPAASRGVLEGLALPGLLLNAFESYRVSADQPLFLGETPIASAAGVAQALAVPLGMTQTEIAHILLTRPRFVKLKADLSEGALKTIQRLQGTMFVVQPGKIFDAGKGTDAAVGKELDSAVTRLYDMLNEKGKPVQITQPQIRERLSPGVPPGILGIRVGKEGQPDILIPRKLYAKPIPGVIYGLPGIGLLQEPCRHYPFGALASASLGWVGDVHTNPHGAFGLEEMLEKQLRGVDGREVKEIDAKRRTMPERSTRTDPVNGLGVVLTLDISIQQAAEEWLAKRVIGPDGTALRGACIAMDPNTGEILALATCPAWDGNNPAKSTLPRVNPAISNFYEPGSAFKVVAVMGALEEGLVHDGQVITNCTGSYAVGNRVIHEAKHERHGVVDCGGLLEQSCNIGAAHLSLLLGPQRFLKWCDRLGFGHKTGIELAQESPGFLNRAHVDAKITLANMGFGQSLAVTPLQMVAAYSAIANGGEWVQPHLVKSVQQPDGSWKDMPPALRRRVCSTKTAALMRGYLERVVAGKHGTATHLSLIKYGFRIGGKTGTAQKPGPHGYKSGSYIGSFVGVLPIDNPRIVMIAVIDEPKGGSYFGAVAAGPVVQNAGLRALQLLNVPPSVPTGPGKKTTTTDKSDRPD